MKKVIAGLLSAAVLALALAGCGGGIGASAPSGKSAAPQSAAASGAVKELDVFWFADGGETAAMEKLIEEYEGLHPDIKIDLLEVPFEDMQNKIMMSVSGGEAPAMARTTEGIISAVHDLSLIHISGGLVWYRRRAR